MIALPDNIQIHATRDGDRVTGHVSYDNALPDLPIRYRSERPSGSRAKTDRETMRMDAVQRYNEVVATGTLKRGDAAALVRSEFGRRFSVRSLQLWVRKASHGDDLHDAPTLAPRAPTVLSLSQEVAQVSVMAAAWWHFRLQDLSSIDNEVMHVVAFAVAQLNAPPADILSAIDCYYRWPCDRSQHGFKPLSRWFRFDLEKWLHRAANQHDADRSRDAERRYRATMNQRTRSDIRAIADNAIEQALTNRPRENANGEAFDRAKNMSALGADPTARRLRAAATPGVVPLVAIKEPDNIVEAVGAMDDQYRDLILRASRNDPVARRRAIATRALWWSDLPGHVQRSIENQVELWLAKHAAIANTAKVSDTRRVDIFLCEYRKQRGSHTKRLGVALRLPAPTTKGE